MANTFDSALIVDSVSSVALKKLPNRLSALALASKRFDTDVKKPGETVQVKVASATASTEVDPTDFDTTGGTTVGAVGVTLHHIRQPFGLSNEDLKNGFTIEQVIGINIDAFAQKIWELFTAPITVANFGAAVANVTEDQVTPGSAHVKAAWAAVSKSSSKAFVANSLVYANFIPTSTQSLPLTAGAYGFENGVHYATSFAGETGMIAFAADPNALAIASAKPPLEDAAGYLVNESLQIPELGITVYWNLYYSKAKRAYVGSIETMFGCEAAVKQGTCAIIIND